MGVRPEGLGFLEHGGMGHEMAKQEDDQCDQDG